MTDSTNISQELDTLPSIQDVIRILQEDPSSPQINEITTTRDEFKAKVLGIIEGTRETLTRKSEKLSCLQEGLLADTDKREAFIFTVLETETVEQFDKLRGVLSNTDAFDQILFPFGVLKKLLEEFQILRDHLRAALQEQYPDHETHIDNFIKGNREALNFSSEEGLGSISATKEEQQIIFNVLKKFLQEL